MLITRGPSHALVSPPTRSTPNRSARVRMPAWRPAPTATAAGSRQGDGDHRGAGTPAIAAMSERFTPIALYPTASGPSWSRRKWRPSMSMSVVTRRLGAGARRRIAQSSPMPILVNGLVRDCSRRRIQSIRANSPVGLIRPSS